jgi:hypothetical protein
MAKIQNVSDVVLQGAVGKCDLVVVKPKEIREVPDALADKWEAAEKAIRIYDKPKRKPKDETPDEDEDKTLEDSQSGFHT